MKVKSAENLKEILDSVRQFVSRLGKFPDRLEIAKPLWQKVEKKYLSTVYHLPSWKCWERGGWGNRSLPTATPAKRPDRALTIYSYTALSIWVCIKAFRYLICSLVLQELTNAMIPPTVANHQIRTSFTKQLWNKEERNMAQWKSVLK